ncbi:hypothetical protein BC629DRAFT_1446784 [Irpex lacteus]|nr:hypothetical protein BC629DRAFT_1446784 [Irpex lacteus]
MQKTGQGRIDIRRRVGDSDTAWQGTGKQEATKGRDAHQNAQHCSNGAVAPHQETIRKRETNCVAEAYRQAQSENPRTITKERGREYRRGREGTGVERDAPRQVWSCDEKEAPSRGLICSWLQCSAVRRYVVPLHIIATGTVCTQAILLGRPSMLTSQKPPVHLVSFRGSIEAFCALSFAHLSLRDSRTGSLQLKPSFFSRSQTATTQRLGFRSSANKFLQAAGDLTILLRVDHPCQHADPNLDMPYHDVGVSVRRSQDQDLVLGAPKLGTRRFDEYTHANPDRRGLIKSALLSRVESQSHLSHELELDHPNEASALNRSDFLRRQWTNVFNRQAGRPGCWGDVGGTLGNLLHNPIRVRCAVYQIFSSYVAVAITYRVLFLVDVQDSKHEYHALWQTVRFGNDRDTLNLTSRQRSHTVRLNKILLIDTDFHHMQADFSARTPVETEVNGPNCHCVEITNMERSRRSQRSHRRPYGLFRLHLPKESPRRCPFQCLGFKASDKDLELSSSVAREEGSLWFEMVVSVVGGIDKTLSLVDAAVRPSPHLTRECFTRLLTQRTFSGPVREQSQMHPSTQTGSTTSTMR